MPLIAKNKQSPTPARRSKTINRSTTAFDVSQVTPKAASSNDFKSELALKLEVLRQSLKQLLKEVGSPLTPRVLQHQLKVPYAACWQAFRIARSVDAMQEAQHAPSPGMLKGLLASARNHGATEPTTAAVASAADEFHKFVTHQAGDRSTFNSMVAEETDGSQYETVILQRRRAAYRAMSQLWGVQTDLQCMTSIVGPPTNDPSDLTAIGLLLQRGVRRLHAGVPVTLMGHHTKPVATSVEPMPIPLDPVAADKYGMPILSEFSSEPLPRIELVTTPSGWRLFNMIGGDIGLRSSIDFAVGGLMANTPSEIEPDGRKIHWLSFTTNRKPVALLVMDLIVHRAAFQGIRPQSLVHHHQEGDYSMATALRAQRFPGEETVEFAGRADSLDLIEAPRYAELLSFAAAAKSWDLAEFDAYRIRIPYPMLCTTTRIFYYSDK